MGYFFVYFRIVTSKCFFFFFYLPASAIPSPYTCAALPHRHRCGPLGCLSAARSDFDICWNAQRSVQAWKEIQSFDPKPLVFFAFPSPFHQNPLCAHRLPHRRRKMWKTFPCPTLANTCAPMSAMCTRHIQMHKRGKKDKKKTKTMRDVKSSRCETRSPSPLLLLLQTCAFRQASIFYEHTKDGVSARTILWWPVLTSRKTITAPVISGGQEHQNLLSELQPAVCAGVCSHSWNKEAAQSNFKATGTPAACWSKRCIEVDIQRFIPL